MDVMERTHAEESPSRQVAGLHQQLQALDTVMSSMQDFVYLFDLSGRFTYVNKPLLDLWQKTLDQSVGKNFHDLEYPPDLAARLQRQIQEVITSRKPLKDETPYTSASGTGQYEYIFVPLFAVDGAVEAVAGVTRDITERKRTEEELLDLKNTLAADLSAMTRLHELSMRLAASSELQSLLEEVLDAAIELQGADFGNVQLYNLPSGGLEIVAQRGFDHDFLDYFSRPGNDGACGRAMARRERVIVEDVEVDPEYAPHRPAAAAAGYRAVQSTPLIDRNGELLGMLSTHFRQPHRPSERELRLTDLYARQAADIIGFKLAEEALRRREEHFRALLAKGADMITVSDATGAILYASPSTERVSGYTPQEFQGSNPFVDSIHPDDVGRCREALARLHATPGLSIHLEHRARPKSGEWRWFGGTFTSLFHDPAVGGLVANVRDITERKAAEEEVARSYAAEQVARAEAESALRIREQFLSIASHELRTPLASLMGYADMLHTATARGKKIDTQKLTDRITRQAQRLDRLIGQLLDVSRLQEGQFAIERRPVDVAALAEQVVEEFRATLPPDTGHTVEMIRPDEPVMVEGDAHRLEDVLSNLLGNAVKYSPSGGTVRVSVMSAATEAVLEIADRGIGIPTHAQELLFEPFYRANNVGPQSSGFGLGLHIVREIVHRHGGRVAVTSAEGVGSTFRVVLPLGNDSDD